MSTKNRFKKLRKITVDNIIYYWQVSDNNCDGDGGDRFRIYLDRKLIFKDLIHGIIVTPKLVREQILKINKQDDN